MQNLKYTLTHCMFIWWTTLHPKHGLSVWKQGTQTSSGSSIRWMAFSEPYHDLRWPKIIGQQGALLPGFPRKSLGWTTREAGCGRVDWEVSGGQGSVFFVDICLDRSNQSIGFNRLIATRRESLWLRFWHQPVVYPIYQIWGVFNPVNPYQMGQWFPGWAKHLILVFFDPWRIWSIFLKTMWWFLGTATRSFNLCASPRSWRSVSWKMGSRLKKWKPWLATPPFTLVNVYITMENHHAING